MGWYIECEESKGKVAQIVRDHGANIIDRYEAKEAMSDPDKAVIVVVDNGFFEAAGFACNQNEFDAFTDIYDRRNKWFLKMDRKLAKELTGYKGV